MIPKFLQENFLRVFQLSLKIEMLEALFFSWFNLLFFQTLNFFIYPADFCLVGKEENFTALTR